MFIFVSALGINILNTAVAQTSQGGDKGSSSVVMSRNNQSNSRTVNPFQGFWTKSGSHIHNNNNGYVGIGTSFPFTPLEILPMITIAGGENKILTIRSDSDISNTASTIRLINSTQANYNGGSVDIVGLRRNEEGGKGQTIPVSEFIIRTSYGNYMNEAFRIDEIGFTGIGVTDPSCRLDVSGRIRIRDTFNGDGQIQLEGGNPGEGKILTSNANGLGRWETPLWSKGGGDDIYRLNGNVSIGNISSQPEGYRLFVEAGILTEKIKVAVKDTDDWADHVFDDEYILMEINEVEKYIIDNKHLPGVPSANEVVEHGVDLLEMNALMLEKIEELTLHMIEQHKIINELNSRIAKLEKEVDSN